MYLNTIDDSNKAKLGGEKNRAANYQDMVSNIESKKRCARVHNAIKLDKTY